MNRRLYDALEQNHGSKVFFTWGLCPSTGILGTLSPNPWDLPRFPPEWLFYFGAAGAAPPFRPLGRRSGRIPALPYPPPR